MQKDRLYKVSNIAEDLSVSTTTVYKHIKKLKERLSNSKTKEKGVVYFNQEGYDLITSSITETIPSADCKSLSTGFEVGLNDRLKGLEQAVMLLVESNNKLTKQNQNLVETVNIQSKKLKMIQLSLAAPKPKPVKVWKPEKKKSPDISYLKKLWYSLVSPERLRAY